MARHVVDEAGIDGAAGSLCECVIASAIVGAFTAAEVSCRSCSLSTARALRVAFATHIRPALSDMWQRPGIWGYCWQSVGPVRVDDTGGELAAGREPERPTAAKRRRASAPQDAQATAAGGGLGAQCSARVPQEAQR